jgi:hypothetical protein
MNKKNFTKFIVLTVICVMAISYNTRPVFGEDKGGPSAAYCDISVTVDSIVEWEGTNFAAIDLDQQNSGHIVAQETVLAGSSHYTLWTNSNVTLSADNTGNSRLTHVGPTQTDYLVTKYKISTDGDGDLVAGITATGSSDTDRAASGAGTWTDYDQFLTTALPILHFDTDGAVEVTLNVQASNDTDNVADRGLYQAVQTITATWSSNN